MNIRNGPKRKPHVHSNILTIERALRSRVNFAKDRLEENASFFRSKEELETAFDGVKREMQNVESILQQWPTETSWKILQDFRKEMESFKLFILSTIDALKE